MTIDQSTGILLVGHGTRDAVGQAEFRQVGAMLRESLPGMPVADCFLELAEPDIPSGIESLISAGVRKIIAAPLLLFAAGHAKRDIPEAVDEAVRTHRGASWWMAAPLGEHPTVLRLAAQRFKEARREGGDEHEEATLVVVSRGSSDPSAIENVHQFVEALRPNLDGVAEHQVCFLAAAQPTLDESLAWAVAQPSARVIVQPHLLFHGQLIQDVSQSVDSLRSDASVSKQWCVAKHLGPCPPIVEAVLARIREIDT